jgi:hypothetical protein
MPRANAPLSPAAINALSSAQVTDRTITLTCGQLDRPVYEEVNAVLNRVAGGGKWNRRAQAHLFTEDPAPSLGAVLTLGVMPADVDKLNSFFATPAPIAERMAGYFAANSPDDLIWEPSAGDGAIADAMRKVAPRVQLACIEPDRKRADVLRGKGHVTYQTTFGDHADTGAMNDACGFVMNPPFTVPGDPAAWLAHLELAWLLLRPRGQIVAIVPMSLLYRTERPYAEMRQLIRDNGGSWEELPAGTFKASGTGVNTAFVHVMKQPL